MKKLKKFFKLGEHKTTVKTEIYAGIATFLAMAYVLVVNPNNLLQGNISDPRWASVFIATAIGAFVGTLAMSLIANKPFGAASTMGVNAMVGTIIGSAAGFSFSYGNGMLIILLSGLIFFLLSILPCGHDKDGKSITIREYLFIGTPKCIISAIPIGIGLFITIIGLKNSGLIEPNDFTLVNLVDFSNSSNWVFGGSAWGAVVTLFGVTLISILSHYKVKAAVIFGILGATILAFFTGIADINILLGKDEIITWSIFENIGNYFSLDPNNGGIFLSVLTEGFKLPEGSLFTLISLVITLIMLDIFDTIGTIVGCCSNAGLVDETGKPEDYNKIMYADSLSTCASSIVGTSTVSTYIESGAGIATGGKTGLTGLTIALLFLASIFLLPVFAFIPIEAASSALLYIGVIMFKDIKKVNFDDIKEAIPAFLTIIFMPLSYSITNGIGLGVITYFVIHLIIYIVDRIKGKKNKFNISAVTIVIFILFLIYFLMPKII